MSQQINLFNPIFLKQQKVFSALTMLQALGLILVGALAVAGYAAYQASFLAKSELNMNAQLTAAQVELGRANAEYGKREKSKGLEDEIRNAEADVNAMTQVLGVLKKGEFGNTKGYSDYLRAFARQSMDGLWLTGFSLLGAGDEIALQGRVLRAELVSEYIGALRRESIMQGKSFSSLEMSLKQAEPTGKAAAEAKPRRSIEFVEFRLQSEDAAKAGAEAAGAKAR